MGVQNRASDLLAETVRALEIMLRFETALRERVLAEYGQEARWWKRRVPNPIRVAASDRRARDRASPFASALSYHELYYCYIDDLKQIITQANNSVDFLPPGDKDLVPRFDELTALRNRAAHGRLLTVDEATRATQIANELTTLLALSLPEQLTFEDPKGTARLAVSYLRAISDEGACSDVPSSPEPIARLMRSPVASERVPDHLLAVCDEVVRWVGEVRRLDGKPGFRLDIARLRKDVERDGLLARISSLISTLEGIE